MTLADERCAPCRADAGLLPPSDVGVLMREVPGWAAARRAGVLRLEKSFEFPDFSGALAFAAKVGVMADAQDHHPEITVAWGRATVSWWTHRLEGLHRNDFICAARTDILFRG